MTERYYLIRLVAGNMVINEVGHSGENALSAFENAVDQGILSVPYGFMGDVVVLREDSLVLRFELGYAD